jgi:histidyl-tRNA synthetase
MAYKGKMKQRLAKADALGARYALILGDDELAAGVVAVKDLATGDQRKVAFADVAEALR